MMFIKALLITAFAFVILGCQEEERVVRDIEKQFYDFTKSYNREIEQYLEKELSELEAKLATVGDDSKGQAEIKKKIAKIKFRQDLGDFFSFKATEDLPKDLEWETGMNEPEIGDPMATKGGVMRRHQVGYPSTFRSRGKNSNNQFKGFLHNEIGMGLVSAHPVTYNVIPGAAQRWAVSEDGRTVYYHLHDDVTYNDGSRVEAWHYPFDLYLEISDNVFAPSVKQYVKEMYGQMTVYGDRYVALTLAQPKLYMPLMCSRSPSQPEFYRYFGPDYEEYYSWKPEPTIGAYEVKEGNFVKGVNITQTRVKDWWAKDMKYYRYRFNVDAINWRTIREETKAFEYFKAGQLDYFDFKEAGPEYWYDKSETEAFHNGYISKVTFYNEYPRFPRGLYLNVTRGVLANETIRVGMHHAMNWQKVIDVVYRGDYSRLNQMADGYGPFTNPAVKARTFEVTKARKLFAEAGYKKVNNDGYLINEKGEVLSIEVTYASLEFLTDMMLIVQKEAKKAGVKVILRGLETTVFFRTITNKDFQSVFMSFGISPPYPTYYNYYHSDNAFDDKGNPKSSTNNMFIYADKEVDRLSEITRETGDVDVMIENGHKIQQRIHDAAIFIPAYTKPFRRVAFQRWVEWPDTSEMQFNPPIVDEPHEWHVYWINEGKKEKTLEAKRKGKAFPESVLTFGKNPQQGGGDE